MKPPLEPVTRHPDDLTARLWRERTEPPLVTIRCGRGKRPCRDRIGHVYETPGSAVVVFFQHTPDQPVSLDLPNGLPESYAPSPSFKKFDPEARQAMLRGRRDDRGTAVSLEDDDYWSNIVEAGCRKHLGLLPLSRADLMTAVREARATGTPTDVLVPPTD